MKILSVSWVFYGNRMPVQIIAENSNGCNGKQAAKKIRTW
jgi:hypothetical protein